MFSKDIETSTPIQTLLAQRWSGVCFDPQRSVSNTQLLALTEAARWAPSCFGDQPWRFIICDKHSNRPAWEKAWHCLNEGNQDWCQHAPVLIISCHDTVFSKNDKPNAYGAYDTGAAAMSLCIQATGMGLMTHQMAGFKADKVQADFAIPARFQPKAMMALGYQLPKDNLPDAFSERELKPRQRNPLGEHFFAGIWGEGITASQTGTS